MIEKPQYSMSFDDPAGEVHKGTDSNVNELTKKVLRSLSPSPTIPDVPDTFVKLPAGVIRDGEVINTAEVQELTGEHEEELAKARASSNPAKFVSVLLKCGTVSIGEEKVTTPLLDSLIQGDLDTLLLGIRKATFGNDFEVLGVPCGNCGEANDIKLNLSDIPMKELEDSHTREFSVPLRKNRKATIVFPTGKVQNELFKSRTTPLTVPEMNSITLANCVLSFTEADGTVKISNGLADVKKLSISDRNTIATYIFDNQPGPRYDQVTAVCPKCEEEMAVPMTVGILFREI